MPEQAEFNCLVVTNLADLEAASHHVESVIEPMLEAEVSRAFADFIKRHGWGGEFDALDSFWFAPPAWGDPDGNEGDYVCHFEVDWAPRSGEDYFWLSALTGAGQTTAGLYWTSESMRPAQLAKLIAAHPAIVEKLQSRGFVYDIGDKHALYLPIALDREQLLAGLRDDNLEDAADIFATVFEAAAGAQPLFAPLVDALTAADEQ